MKNNALDTKTEEPSKTEEPGKTEGPDTDAPVDTDEPVSTEIVDPLREKARSKYIGPNEHPDMLELRTINDDVITYTLYDENYRITGNMVDGVVSGLIYSTDNDEEAWNAWIAQETRSIDWKYNLFLVYNSDNQPYKYYYSNVDGLVIEITENGCILCYYDMNDLSKEPKRYVSQNGLETESSDGVHTYEYDEMGRPVYEEYTAKGDATGEESFYRKWNYVGTYDYTIVRYNRATDEKEEEISYAASFDEYDRMIWEHYYYDARGYAVTIEYDYDEYGRLVRKSNNGSITEYVLREEWTMPR